MTLIDVEHFLKPYIEEDPEFYDWDATVIAKFLEDDDSKAFYGKYGYSKKVLKDMINAFAAFIRDPSVFLNSTINYLNFCKAMVGEPLALDKLIPTDDNGLYIGTMAMISCLDLVKKLNSDDPFTILDVTGQRSFMDYIAENDIAYMVKNTFELEGFLLMPYPFNIIDKYCIPTNVQNDVAEDLKYVNASDMVDNISSIRAILPSLSPVAKAEVKRHITLYTTYKFYTKQLKK